MQHVSAVWARGKTHADDDFAGFGELDRVTYEVEHDLTQTPRIAVHHQRDIEADIGEQFNALGVGFQRVDLDRLLDDVEQIEFDVLERELLGFDLGQIENVVDLTQQRLAGVTKHADVLFLLARQ